jgi:homoserine O-acetyltransferase/O-succinyltransferase
MKASMVMNRLGSALLLALLPFRALGFDYPTPKEADFVLKDFRFASGEVMANLRLHYTTVGDPKGEPVLVLHGTTGSGKGMLTPAFAGVLLGPGQPLDASKYFIILPDGIGTGQSSRPSEGLRAKFPRYTYDDMVAAQHRLVTEGLGIKHLRLVIGNSMGGMHTWLWGVRYPGFADALVPMASQPTAMSSRNWMMRRLLIETVRADPDYKGGDYTSAPRSLTYANALYGVGSNGGTLAWQDQAPTRAKADALVDKMLAAPFALDANDYLYQWEASRDYDPSSELDRIDAAVLAINSADDERNPPETGVLESAMKRVKNGRVLLVPASAETRGHSTTAMAKFWAEQLRELLAAAPRRGT